jgi:hypothetical protein
VSAIALRPASRALGNAAPPSPSASIRRRVHLPLVIVSSDQFLL